MGGHWARKSVSQNSVYFLPRVARRKEWTLELFQPRQSTKRDFVWRANSINAVCGAIWEAISVLLQQQFKRNDLCRARREFFYVFPMLDKDSLLASFFLIIYEIREIKQFPRCDVHFMQRILSFCEFLIWDYIELYGNNFQCWTEMRSLLFVVVCRVLYVESIVRGNFCSLFCVEHLLRRFTDCTQLSFSSSSTFWFSASAMQGRNALGTSVEVLRRLRVFPATFHIIFSFNDT